jgi:hypothetical protein
MSKLGDDVFYGDYQTKNPRLLEQVKKVLGNAEHFSFFTIDLLSNS